MVNETIGWMGNILFALWVIPQVPVNFFHNVYCCRRFGNRHYSFPDIF